MARLTNLDRDTITAAAVAAAFKPRKEALDKAEDALAREAYATLFTKAELAAVAKLPENWLRFDSCLKFNVGGQRITLNATGGLPVPYKPKGSSDGGYYCHTIGTIEFGDLCDRIQAHAIAVESLKAERAAAARAVKALVYSVSTTNKFKEVWPEGEAFFSNLTPTTAANLPAIQVQHVNELLGLPIAA